MASPIQAAVCRLPGLCSRSCMVVPTLLSKASYHSKQEFQHQTQDTRVVDLRSDVLTQPTAKMKRAMVEAYLGDNVFDEDTVTTEFEKQMADLLGKEAALFVCSGTMGNLVSVLAHCNTRGSEVIVGDMSHLVHYEQGGMAQVGGVFPRTVMNNPDGTFDLDGLDNLIRPRDDAHQPWTRLICVENTHNNCGGTVLPLSFLASLREKADAYGVPVHCDGARLMNAAVALDTSPKEIMKYIDSVSVCLSKGVGTPVGSVVAGSQELIDRAYRLRKVVGGGMRQPGLLSAAGSVAMEDVWARMQQDHKHAKMLAQAVKDKGEGIVNIDLDGVHTNLILFEVVKPGLEPDDLVRRLQEVTEQEYFDMKERISVRSGLMALKKIRFVAYSTLMTEDIEAAIKKINYVLEELSSSHIPV